MVDTSTTPSQLWDTVAEHIRSKIEPVSLRGPRARAPIIAYLRDLEAVARSECQKPEVIQVIVLVRRILGDRTIIKSEKPLTEVSRSAIEIAGQSSKRVNAR